MKRVLHVFRDPPLDGPTNMARDEHLLHSDRFRPAALRFYAWDPPTVSLGCFQRYGSLATLPAEVRALAVVRRPTGGGAILHDREVTYCLVVDETLEITRRAPVALYRLVHELWHKAIAADLQRTGGAPPKLAPEHLPLPSPRGGPFFCFEKPGRTDLLIGRDKVLGSAQRRVAGRVLQHGSLLLGRRFTAHPGAHLNEPSTNLVERWIGQFTKTLAQALSLTVRPAEWTNAALDDVRQRRERYCSDAWTQRH
jgi:lipoate-protein ligase A